VEELIFFAVIIFFSILESVARSKRAKARKESGQAEPEQFEWAQTPPWERELPSYDQDPSYDDRIRGAEPRRSGAPTSDVRGEREEYGPKTGAERAAELLAELAGLSGPDAGRRRPEARPIPAPHQSPPLPTSTGTFGGAEVARRGVEIGEHEIHRAHAGYGTDPSERVRSREDFAPSAPSAAARDAMAVRAELLGGGTSALRRSIILTEVLGQPLGLRE